MDSPQPPEVPPGQCPQCSARNTWVDLNGHLVLVTPFCHCTCKEGCDVAACMICGYKGVENDFMEGGAMGKKYNADLQDADPDYHPSRVTFQEVELLLLDDKTWFYKRCRVCHEPVTFTMITWPPNGVVEQHLCACRPDGKCRKRRLSWDALQALVTTGKIPFENAKR